MTARRGSDAARGRGRGAHFCRRACASAHSERLRGVTPKARRQAHAPDVDAILRAVDDLSSPVILAGIAVLMSGSVAGLNAYQAITGRRLSKAPSKRDDATMRRQSAIAALLLGTLAVLGIAFIAAVQINS
ncbi:hypothetical protein KRMM14A1259_48520 [Krasilnikovia sp. MM14-A1259]